jgi:hypothetical protein
MKTKNKFKIVKLITRDPFGSVVNKNYQIMVRKTFLGIPYWEYLDMTYRNRNVSMDLPLKFKSYKDAKKHVKKLRKKDITRLDRTEIVKVKVL